jgi:hypothetical protein
MRTICATTILISRYLWSVMKMEQLELDFGDEHRLAAIAQNGNTGEHYDMVNHPPHYTSHPSGIECITVTEHMTFCIGNAIKYLWRVGLKSDNAIQDLEKARWYIDREIARRKRK